LRATREGAGERDRGQPEHGSAAGSDWPMEQSHAKPPHNESYPSLYGYGTHH
jgi:hypothetical protein